MSSDKIKTLFMKGKLSFKLLTFVALLWRRLTSLLARCVQRSIISAIWKLSTFVNWVVEENNTCMMSLMPANKTNTCTNTGFCLLFNCILHVLSCDRNHVILYANNKGSGEMHTPFPLWSTVF